jgi:hypothetical protein
MIRASIILILILAAWSSRADIPAGADVHTVAAFLHGHCEFQLRRALDGYQKSPRRGPLFDDRAKQFLSGCIRRWNNEPGAPSIAELEEQGRLLYLDGCNDALVVSFYGRLNVPIANWGLAKFRNMLPEQASNVVSVSVPFLQQANDDLTRQGYSADFFIDNLVALREARAILDDNGEVKKLETSLYKAIARAASDGTYDKRDRAFLVHDVWRWTNEYLLEQQKRLAETLEATQGCDEATSHLAQGWYHSRATPIGQAGDHADQARKHLTAAWELDPSLPEAARGMIKLCTGRENREQARLWFDRSVKARFDDPRNYEIYLDFLWWGGWDTLAEYDEATLALGRECAHTARFDTQTPRQLLAAVGRILNMHRTRYESLKDLAVWPDIKTVYEGYIASPAFKDQADLNRSALAGFAARLGEFDEARKLLDQLGDHLDAAGTAQTRFKPAMLKGMVEAYTGPTRKLVERADGLIDSGNGAQALDVYQDAMKLQTTPAASRYLRGQTQIARWKKAFDAGEWVNLAADSDLSGFNVIGGTWTTDGDGSLTLRVTDSESNISCMLDIGENWEMSCDVNFLASVQTWTNGGINLTPIQHGLFRSFQLCCNTNKVYSGTGYFSEGASDAPVKRVNKLEVRLQSQQLSASVNGTAVLPQKTFNSLGRNGYEFLGFGSYTFRMGDLMRFERIKVHKLDP